MEGYEVDNCLKSMEILVDTREQPSERAVKRFNSFGCGYRRQKLNYGDYTYDFLLPNGEHHAAAGREVFGDVVIERKMDLGELSACFCQERKRFEAEFERAREHGAKIYLLVENANWEMLINGRYKTRFNPNAYLASLTAFMARYNISVIFCKSETSGKLIKEILYRELKERLVRGEYG